MKHQIISDINKFKEEDIYSAMLYALYKLTQDSNYSVISELIYVLDKESFLNLCSVMGGCTITIPTIQQLTNLTKSLLLYQYINFDNMSFEEALKSLNLSSDEAKELLKSYEMVVNILNEYSK